MTIDAEFVCGKCGEKIPYPLTRCLLCEDGALPNVAPGAWASLALAGAALSVGLLILGLAQLS